VSIRARFAGIMSSLLLAVVALSGPLAAPASAGYTTLCWGYKGCASKGMTASGYASVNQKMYWRMYAGHNCTNYAAYRMVKSGMPNERPWSGSGNAENWGLAMSSITNQTPTVGSVAWWKQNVWPAGSAGHVAYVERVVSPTEIIVSQDSWGGDFSWARISKDGKGWPNGFVHFNDVKLTNTAVPTVTGIAKVGGQLTASTGSWSPSSVTLGYQWLADGAAIAGATLATYTPTTAELGKALRVRVTASKAGYPATSALSAATAAVLPGEITNQVAPAIPGIPVVEKVVTASTGKWYPKPDSLTLRWKADGERIDGANTATLEVTPDLVDKKLTLVTVARREGYARVRVFTDAATPVAPGTLRLATPPAVTGTPRLGQTLGMAGGAVTPEGSGAVEWLRDGAVVDGVAGTAYELTPEDLGRRIVGRITYTRPGYTPLTVRTAPTAAVRTVSVMSVDVTPGARIGRIKVVANLTAPGPEVVEGVVRIRSGGKLLAEVPLVEGRAAKRLSGLPSGKRQVRVRYVGNPMTTSAESVETVRIR
jgi:surface antigen